MRIHLDAKTSLLVNLIALLSQMGIHTRQPKT